MTTQTQALQSTSRVVTAAAGAPSSAAAFVGSVPACYDRHLGPLLFEFSAADLARRVTAASPGQINVLEVACGTGIVTEHLWRALPGGSQLVATDLNPAMLDYATTKRGSLSNVTYRQADALALPFDDDSFDAVVCQFGIMFFPDKVQGLREMARVLRPGGRLWLNVWGSLDDNRVVKIAHETIGSFFESDPPRFLEVPFGDHDVSAIEALFRAAGLPDVESTVVRADVKHSAESAARGLVAGNPGVLEIQQRATVDSETIVAAVTRAVEEAYDSARPMFSLQEIVFGAAKPSTTAG